MGLLYRYCLILIACGALLLGIQVPNFIDQYQKRLDAHLREAQTDLKGYQDIANREFGGSLEALIAKHAASQDPVFSREAAPLLDLYARYQRFNSEKSALATGLPGRVLYLARNPDRELLEETYANYSFAVPLDATAVAAGFAAAAVVLLPVELLGLILGTLFGFGRRGQPQQRIRTLRI
jgi:Protein of unknown function (DUF2937)